MRRTTYLAGAALLVVVTACSGSDTNDVGARGPTAGPPTVETSTPGEADDGAAVVSGDDTSDSALPTAAATSPPEEPAEVVTATPAPAPSEQPQPPADPTPLVDDPCAEPLPADATDVTTAPVDHDADGAPDTMTVYASAGLFRVRVETAAGRAVDSPLGIDLGVGGVRALGGYDVNGDGDGDELFTVVGVGASGSAVSIHVLVDCELLPAQLGGAPAVLPVGGGAASLSGVECADTDANGVNNEIVAWQATADVADPTTYDALGIRYELRGDQLNEVGVVERRTAVGEPGFVYGSLLCGTLILG